MSHSPWCSLVLVLNWREKQRKIEILGGSRNKSLGEMQQIKSSIYYYVGLQWHVQVCRIASLFIQVIPVSLFLAHDQNYDAIFRSQYEEGEKTLKKGIA